MIRINRISVFLRKLLITVFLCISSIYWTCSVLDPSLEDLSDLDSGIREEMERLGIPSVAACIVSGDQIMWEGYYGVRDHYSQQQVNQNTVYALASVSKPVIAVAVFQLVEKGLIDISADINRYLPYSVRNPRFPDTAITTYHLLTHCSGLAWSRTNDEVPGFYEHYTLDSAPPLAEWIPEFLLPDGDHYVSDVWKDTRPGERELYSNIGAGLLAYIVERVSGVNYEHYCIENIFTPLSMDQTRFSFSDLNIDLVARKYETATTPIGHYRQLSYPTHALKSTAADYARFIMAIMNGGELDGTRILETGTVRQMLTIQNNISGLCMIWRTYLGGWKGHSGGEPGTGTHAEFHSDKKLGMVVFTNLRNKSVYPGNRLHALLQRKLLNWDN